jgi:hypothetical protein
MIGKLILPSFCSGRSATRNMSHINPLNLKTPGFKRHSIFMSFNPEDKLLGVNKGLPSNLWARSIFSLD